MQTYAHCRLQQLSVTLTLLLVSSWTATASSSFFSLPSTATFSSWSFCRACSSCSSLHVIQWDRTGENQWDKSLITSVKHYTLTFHNNLYYTHFIHCFIHRMYDKCDMRSTTAAVKHPTICFSPTRPALLALTCHAICSQWWTNSRIASSSRIHNQQRWQNTLSTTTHTHTHTHTPI